MVLDAYQEEDYAKRLKALLHLAELCVDLLKQNDEHYSDVCTFIYIYICMQYNIHSVPKKRNFFIFPITLSKINRL